MGKELWDIRTADSMKESGIKIWGMEEVLKDIQMEIHIMDSFH